jgi:hypothetical protein
MPLAPEMHVLNGEVGGHQQVVPGRNAKHGAIIANAGDEGSAATGRPADSLDQSLFGKGHARPL